MTPADEPLRIRAAVPADRALLVEFNWAMARETEALELDLAVLGSGVAAVLADPGRGFYLVAERDGAAAGALLITTEWSDWRNAWVWWIQSVYVLPEYRRGGVYRALHAAVLARAEAAGDVRGIRLYVERENDRAQATYRALGMSRSRYDLFTADL